MERTLFLYKIATGLCQQGGIGVGNPSTGLVLPGGLLRDLFAQPAPDPAGSVWEELRTHGEPAELLVRFLQVELLGHRHLATCGFGHCGLVLVNLQIGDGPGRFRQLLLARQDDFGQLQLGLVEF